MSKDELKVELNSIKCEIFRLRSLPGMSSRTALYAYVNIALGAIDFALSFYDEYKEVSHE